MWTERLKNWIKNRVNFYLLLIVLLALFLRAYKFADNFNFNAEFGDNLLDVKNAIGANFLPLVGPQTSHPWLSFGPFYYWLLIPVMKIFNFEPLAAGWIGIVVGVAVVVANYYVINKIFSKTVALLSSFLIAVSPLWVSYSKDARFFFFVTLLFYPFFWSLYKKNFFWAGFWFGLMFSFHYSPVIFVVVILIFWKEKISPKMLPRILVGMLLPNIPLLIYDSQHAFRMISNFLLWIPYRIAGFLGFYPKNNFTLETFAGNLNLVNEFIGKSFTLNEKLWPIISMFILALSLYFLIKKSGKLFLTFSFAVGIVAIFVHGDAPLHYFLPIFPIPLIIFSLFIDSLKDKRKYFFFLLLTILFLLNFNGLLRNTAPVSYKVLKEISGFIVKDAKGQPFSLKRVGSYDYFEENFSQNYRYLMWLYGNEPVKKANLVYTIYEDTMEIKKKIAN